MEECHHSAVLKLTLKCSLQLISPPPSKWNHLPSTLLGYIAELVENDTDNGSKTLGNLRAVCRHWLEAIDGSVCRLMPRPSRMGSLRTIEIIGQRFTRLLHLDLHLLGSRVTDESMNALENLKSLRSLCLSRCQQVICHLKYKLLLKYLAFCSVFLMTKV